MQTSAQTPPAWHWGVEFGPLGQSPSFVQPPDDELADMLPLLLLDEGPLPDDVVASPPEPAPVLLVLLADDAPGGAPPEPVP